VFDFNDASTELQGKQVKAQTLHEMLDYITTQRGTITEAVYPEVVNMVSLGNVQNGMKLTFSSQPICSVRYRLR
jgi:hypothetical protein